MLWDGSPDGPDREDRDGPVGGPGQGHPADQTEGQMEGEMEALGEGSEEMWNPDHADHNAATLETEDDQVKRNGN